MDSLRASAQSGRCVFLIKPWLGPRFGVFLEEAHVERHRLKVSNMALRYLMAVAEVIATSVEPIPRCRTRKQRAGHGTNGRREVPFREEALVMIPDAGYIVSGLSTCLPHT